MAMHLEERGKLGSNYQRSEVGNTLEAQVQFRKELTPVQLRELEGLVQSFQDIFQEKPSWAQGVEHKTRTPARALIRECWCLIPQHLHYAV